MHDQLSKDLKAESKKCISLTQLRRIVEGLDIENFNTINQKYFQKAIRQKLTYWKSIDGKELRGSIDGVKGEKRGENIVLMKDYDSSNSKVLGFYSGFQKWFLCHSGKIESILFTRRNTIAP